MSDFQYWEQRSQAEAVPDKDMLMCESCHENGIITPATTRSTNPDWSGYELCEACARDLDEREPVEADRKGDA